MNVQYAGNHFMRKRLIEVIQELHGYLGPEAQGLSDGDLTPSGRWLGGTLLELLTYDRQECLLGWIVKNNECLAYTQTGSLGIPMIGDIQIDLIRT
jgi:hypothetical protein